MLLLKQDTIKKKRIAKNITVLEFGAGNHKEYKMKIIWDNVVYANEAEGHLSEFYYLVV